MIEVLKFGAPWCGACKSLAPAFQAASEELSGFSNVKFKEVDVEKDPDGLAEAHEIMSLPAVLFIKQGKVIARFQGVRPADYIVEVAKQHI